jgi:magnesium chelatase family protein
MLFRTQSAAVYGIDADLVDIEVDLTPARNEADTPASVTIVGLPDAAGARIARTHPRRHQQ